jgi:hypothetical protein
LPTPGVAADFQRERLPYAAAFGKDALRYERGELQKAIDGEVVLFSWV